MKAQQYSITSKGKPTMQLAKSHIRETFSKYPLFPKERIDAMFERIDSGTPEVFDTFDFNTFKPFRYTITKID